MARMLGMIVLVALVATGAAYGSDAFSFPPAPLPYMFGGQTTVVWQYHPAFRSPYQERRGAGRRTASRSASRPTG